VKELEIQTEYITLGQALKLSGEVSSGIEAKIRIQDGEILVNGDVCTQRGKKLRHNDTFEIDGEKYIINDHS
jgi:ribosome-associated protein